MSKNESVGDMIVSIRILTISLLLLAGVYPTAVTLYANAIFSWKANGSILYGTNGEQASRLVSQDFGSEGWFHGRPSASNFNSLPSGASNLSRTSLILNQQVKERAEKLQKEGINPNECTELLYASASGLDPHITPACAMEEARVLSLKHGKPLDELNALVTKHTESTLLGFIGRDRVNVLSLNLDLRNYLNVR